jgi:beta-lactamase regulating signal transducer with metallopeptidase domain
MMSVETLNAWGAAWAAFMWARLAETAIVLIVVGLLWLILRRRASPQLGYCLFLLVLAKSVLPIGLPVPSRLAGLWPTHAMQGAVAWVLPERLQVIPEGGAELSHAASAATVGVGELVSSGGRAAQASHAERSPVSPYAAAMLCWAAVVLGLLLRFAHAQRRTDQLVHRAKPIDPADLRFDLARMLRQAGVRRPVRLATSSELPSPAVWGPFRPRLIIPQQLARECPPNQMRWILLHELAHIRRGDMLIAPLQKLLQTVYFFNPAVWLANWAVDQQREYACDDTALASCSSLSRHICAEGLLSVVEHANGRPAMMTAPLGFLKHSTVYVKRLARILDDDRRIRTHLSAGALVVLVIMALLVLPSMRVEDDNAGHSPAPGNATDSTTTLMKPGEFVPLSSKADNLVFPAELVGRWEGTCEPVVTWCKQESIAIAVEIHSDGNVVGTIGDAAIENGHAKRNAPLGVLLGNPRYIVVADLDGPLVESEKIERASGSLLFGFEDGQLVGEFNSSGTHFGGRKSMWMKCVDMALSKEGE